MCYSHFFSKKIQNICILLDIDFNESLTNDIVSFEQLGPNDYPQYMFFIEKQENTFVWILLLSGAMLRGVQLYYMSLCTTKPTIRHVTSTDSDQPVHPPIIARVLGYPSLAILEAVEGTGDQ